jgi:hypothetical protein
LSTICGYIFNIFAAPSIGGCCLLYKQTEGTIDGRRNSIVLDVRLFRVADYETDHYKVVAKDRESLAVNKQRSYKFNMEGFNLKKLNEVDGKDQYRVVVPNRFANLETSDDEMDINSARKTIRENIKTIVKESLAYYELKNHKPWFDEGCSNY